MITDSVSAARFVRALSHQELGRARKLGTGLSHVVLNLLFFFLQEEYIISLSNDCVLLPYSLHMSTSRLKAEGSGLLCT